MWQILNGEVYFQLWKDKDLAMCEKNDLGEHFLVYLKHVSNNTYRLDKFDKTWIHKDDITEELPVPNITHCRSHYKFAYEL